MLYVYACYSINVTSDTLESRGVRDVELVRDLRVVVQQNLDSGWYDSALYSLC